MSGTRPAFSLRGITRVLASTRGVNFAATGDQATLALPSTVAKYRVTAVLITNCSTTPVLAQVALYTGASASGITLVGAAVITGASATTVIISSTLAGAVATTALTASAVYVNVPVANVGALTGDVYLIGDDLT